MMMVFFLCRCPLRITVSQQRCADSSAAMSGLDSAGEARQEGPGGVGAALQGWTLRGVSNSWLPSLNNTERTALRPELSRGRDFAWTQRSQDIYLDAECAQASFKIRQPHDTRTNDDGVQVLPPPAPIAQSPSVNNVVLTVRSELKEVARHLSRAMESAHRQVSS